MRQALALAWRGWGHVHPNPMVGAVVLAGGRAVGEGYHAEYGGSHAERSALEAAGARAVGATMVVSLEPCAHLGKQPPCVEALAAAGVRRVVAAVADPNPVAAGGARKLEAAGIEVVIGLLEEEARRLNAAFFHRFSTSDRPWVALKLSTSLDFRIADASGRSRWISGEASRGFVHQLRAGFDAIAVGSRTARRDDPSLTVRGMITPRVAPRRIVFAGSTPLPETLTLVRTARDVPTAVVLPPDAPEPAAVRLEQLGVETLRASSLAEALRSLRRSGVDTLLIEGGGRLAGGLLAAGLVDRFYWIQAPIWLGSRGAPAVSGWDIETLEAAERWTATDRRALGDDTLLVLDRA